MRHLTGFLRPKCQIHLQFRTFLLSTWLFIIFDVGKTHFLLWRWLISHGLGVFLFYFSSFGTGALRLKGIKITLCLRWLLFSLLCLYIFILQYEGHFITLRFVMLFCVLCVCRALKFWAPWFIQFKNRLSWLIIRVI
jgi:hypothetical protein